MKLLIIGNEKCAEELKNQIPEIAEHHIDLTNSFRRGYDVVFLLHDSLQINIDESSHETLFIASSATGTLKELKRNIRVQNICGMNLLPGFISVPVKEVSGSDADFNKFISLTSSFNWKYKHVPDRPGMITLRVLSMIINEAVATIAEGTASIEDIDKGMILGTNYPKGPLQWCDEIGVTNIVHILQSLHDSTGDTRYLVHPYLTSMADSGNQFYSTKFQQAAQ